MTGPLRAAICPRASRSRECLVPFVSTPFVFSLDVLKEPCTRGILQRSKSTLRFNTPRFTGFLSFRVASSAGASCRAVIKCSVSGECLRSIYRQNGDKPFFADKLAHLAIKYTHISKKALFSKHNIFPGGCHIPLPLGFKISQHGW